MRRSEPHVVDDEVLPYLLSLPPAGSARPPEAGWPVLAFLHGHDEAAPVDIAQGVMRHGPLSATSSPAAVRDFIVVAPQLPHGGDTWHRYADAVFRIVEQVRMEHGGDARRTFLTGFSYGGNGVFDLALSRRDYWAALWPVDPTRVPRSDPGRPVWLSVGQVARGASTSFVRALGLEPAGAAPSGDRLYLDEGEDHVGSARSAYADDRIYAWLLSRSPTAGQPVEGA